jgi:hypothetical protein
MDEYSVEGIAADPVQLPPGVTSDAKRLAFSSTVERYNHYVFRFPAKFHPPVARALINDFSNIGDRVLDPFCGSGTLLVEGLLAGRSVVGTDVDPLAIFISSAKTTRYDLDALANLTAELVETLELWRDRDEHRFGPFTADINEKSFASASRRYRQFIPAIPKLKHWFRLRVIFQLAKILSVISEQFYARRELLFAELCFASIIRNASNADPVPVSGLEVTKHMRQREAEGRIIDPYALMIQALQRTEEAMRAFAEARRGRYAKTFVTDVRNLDVRRTGTIDAAITSPPYLSAVDYYRRHQLEMFWLKLVQSHDERLSLLAHYT